MLEYPLDLRGAGFSSLERIEQSPRTDYPVTAPPSYAAFPIESTLSDRTNVIILAACLAVPSR